MYARGFIRKIFPYKHDGKDMTDVTLSCDTCIGPLEPTFTFYGEQARDVATVMSVGREVYIDYEILDDPQGEHGTRCFPWNIEFCEE